MRRPAPIILLLVTLWAPAATQKIAPEVEREARGVWITLSLALTKQTVPQIVQQLQGHNLNLALVMYEASQPMREFAEACRRAGIEVHVWVVPETLVPKPKEEWLVHGYSLAQKDFTARPAAFFEEEYRQAAAARAAEIMKELPCDGLHLDGVRHGLPWDDLGPESCARFAHDTGLKVGDYRSDIVQVANLTADNIGKPNEWAGPLLPQWTRWRCQVVADLFGAMARAVKAVDGRLCVSNACMTDWGSPMYYGVDYSLLAPHLDFLVPMAYYNRYGQDARWAIRRCHEIALQAHAANPKCHVYAGVATYSHSTCRIWIAQVTAEAQKQGKLSAEDIKSNRLLDYFTGGDMLRSATWLYGHGMIEAKTYGQMLNAIITDDEILEAVDLMRAGRDKSLPGVQEYVDEAPVEGIVFFRYFCMFPENTEGVVGNLWDKLRPEFPKPTRLPHRQ